VIVADTLDYVFVVAAVAVAVAAVAVDMVAVVVSAVESTSTVRQFPSTIKISKVHRYFHPQLKQPLLLLLLLQ
jgi:hypothetical protein